MSEERTDDAKLSVSSRKKPVLRSGGMAQGTVRQSFSHGRTKSVVVETRKRRVQKPGAEEGSSPSGESGKRESSPASAAEARPDGASAAPQVAAPRVASPSSAQQADSAASGSAGGGTARVSEASASPSRQAGESRSAAPRGGKPRAAGTRSGGGRLGLSQSEMEARRRALGEARERDDDDRRRRDAESERRARESARVQEERRRADRPPEREGRREDRSRPQGGEATTARASAAPPPEREGRDRQDRSAGAGASGRRAHPGRRKSEEAQRPPRPRAGEDRRRSKLTLSNALNEDAHARGPSLAALRRRQEKARRSAMEPTPREKISREVVLPETIAIQELAARMSERSVEVVKFMMKQGQMLKPGDVVDADTAELIAAEFGHAVKRVSESDVEEGLFGLPDSPESMLPRPPVVTIMGHVDHGKTSLLDAIRDASVAEGEAGGITQRIGAYQAESNGSLITFIDTPGHEAFASMRARGAQVTDIAVLIVAADDGVMPQTVESIRHAKEAGVPLIVAISKMDLEGADAAKVRSDLLRHEVAVESMGGEVLEAGISVKKGEGIDKLLEAILLQGELMDIKANPDRAAEGIVIEAELDRGRGPVATVLVQRGTLRIGDVAVVGEQWGKIRAMIDDKGEGVEEAGPSVPVGALGLNGAPMAGDRLAVVETEARAREICEYRRRLAREKAIAKSAGSRAASLERVMNRLQASERREAVVLVKADFGGSAEAIVQALEEMATEEVGVRVAHSGVGGITESDVALATSSGAPILAFNVRAPKPVREMAERDGVEIRYYSLIYDLVDDMKATLSGLLAPERRETFLGYAEVLQLFDVSKVGKVAGCRVTEGKVERGSGVRLLRDDVVVHEGSLSTLKRFKDEVPEVVSGQECGMAFENWQDMREGDRIECFRVEHIERKL